MKVQDVVHPRVDATHEKKNAAVPKGFVNVQRRLGGAAALE